MARRYGCAPRGSCCRLRVPQGHDETTTVTAVLRSTGLYALSLMDCATNGAHFRSYVTDHLTPIARRSEEAEEIVPTLEKIGRPVETILREQQ